MQLNAKALDYVIVDLSDKVFIVHTFYLDTHQHTPSLFSALW